MIATISAPPMTLAELVHRLGDVPLDRIRLDPPPGIATVADVARLSDAEPPCLCELVDGVLVVKVMGHEEARLATWLSIYLGKYLEDHDIGIVAGADGPHEVLPELVRIPDVSFVAYENIPSDADHHMAVPDWIPTLAVEILSKSNTKGEMARKLQDYFNAGVLQVWYVDPIARTVRVFQAEREWLDLTDADELDGGTILPGFRLSIREWFDRATRVRPSQN